VVEVGKNHGCNGIVFRLLYLSNLEIKIMTKKMVD
jgi:hypothetical protein